MAFGYGKSVERNSNMKELKYIITDEMGLHARSAGRLVKMASGFACDIRIGTAVKMVNAKGILGVMALALKQNDELTMTFDGPDEDEAYTAIKAFLWEYM